MAEIKNSFLRSKMNKDLDDRLIPNGEYRDAQNISVGKSEADDIGALETVLGNTLKTDFGLTSVQVIGQLAIEDRNSVIVFLTDYTDPYTNGNPTLAPLTAKCYIFEYSNGTATKLVEGNFLNFSLTDPARGISVIESLLFWTDNRNQPRKINIDLAANGTYYTAENHISVAKYNPYEPISLLKKVNTTTTTSGSSSTLTVASTVGIEKGMSVVEYGNTAIEPQDYIYVVNINGASTFGSLVGGTGYPNGSTSGVATTVSPDGGTGLTVDITVVLGIITVVAIADPGDGYSVNDVITITGGNGDGTITLTAISNIILNATVSGLTSGDTIYFLSTTMTGEDITFNFNDGSAETWPGDPDYIENRFIRLSYRFEFDDGEYSLMAPFTQICFIPKQKGYFLSGQEDEAYRSTIVQFMENGVQNIELLIPFPDILENIEPSSLGSYKIKALDILYKESDATVVKVIDTIDYNEVIVQSGSAWTATDDTNIYTYNYQSRKPFRSLPPEQIVRVYDKVPVKALTQETSGNRIIYGNFLDKYTPPSILNYIVGVGPKSQALNYDNWCEYPNHSVKQNRNYQVGFVLIDKFGRQSDVILSQIRTTTVTTADGTVYGGDTIYAPYHPNNTLTSIKDWLGDSLKVNIESTINSTLDTQQGTPGLYGEKRLSGFNIASNAPSITSIAPYTYTFKLNGNGPSDIPIVGSYLRGQFKDFVKVTNVASSVITATTTNNNVVTASTTFTLPAPGNNLILPGMTLSGTGVPADLFINVKTDAENFILNKSVTLGANINPITYSITQYVVTCDGPINIGIYSLTEPAITPDNKQSYNINPIGWYSYKIVVKQQEQDYYNCYFPGFLDGYPDQSAVTFPTTEDGKTGHVVLLNDNINKVPRDLSEVGPQQKQFRSSVQLYGRVNNTVSDNLQFFPVTTGNQTLPLSMTVDTIADANDLKMATDEITTPDNFYQLDTNPLIARLTTLNSGTTTIGITDATMVPQLSIAETEPQDSLLNLFWETPTVGLITDLNQIIDSSYEGPVGFQNYNSNLLTEGMTGDFITGLSPVDVSGSNLINTAIAGSWTVLDNNTTNVSSKFTVTRTGAGTLGNPYLYNFGISNTTVADDFVFNSDPNPRIYTLTITIVNNAVSPAITSEPLELVFSLTNVVPEINGGAPLTPITGVQSAFTGELTAYSAAADINGVNGALVAGLNQEEVVWSIVGGNSNNYFSIDQDGIVSKIVGDIPVVGATLGTHLLEIRLHDANADTSNGSLYDTKTLSVSVASTVIGTPFTASPSGVINQSCASDGSLNPLCGTATFYNQTSVSPTVNDEIRTGPSGSASPLAAAGYYSYDCGTTGAGNRKYFKILASSLGIIDTVSTC